MTVYVVLRTLTTVSGASINWPVGSFRDRDRAVEESNRHNRVMIEAIGTDFARGTLLDFLRGLGLASVEHDVLEMNVEDNSLIEVPKVRLQ